MYVLDAEILLKKLEVAINSNKNKFVLCNKHEYENGGCARQYVTCNKYVTALRVFLSNTAHSILTRTRLYCLMCNSCI